MRGERIAVVDYCSEDVDGFADTKGRAVCGSPEHGTCQSNSSEAWCDCKHGWTGPHCQTPDPNTLYVATRCALFPTNETLKAGLNTTCPHPPEGPAARCLTDNLDCAFRLPNCLYPVGWCVPIGQTLADLVHEDKVANKGFIRTHYAQHLMK